MIHIEALDANNKQQGIRDVDQVQSLSVHWGVLSIAHQHAWTYDKQAVKAASDQGLLQAQAQSEVPSWSSVNEPASSTHSISQN